MDDRQRVDGVIRPLAIPIRQGVEDWLRVDDADSPEVVHEEEAPPVVANLSQAVSDVRVKLRLVPVGYMEWVAAAPLINVSGPVEPPGVGLDRMASASRPKDPANVV